MRKIASRVGLVLRRKDSIQLSGGAAGDSVSICKIFPMKTGGIASALQTRITTDAGWDV
jgi:hypothetical protein